MSESKRMPCPEPGVYRGIEASEYHAWDAMSNSRLKVLVQDSPKHFKWRLDHPKPPTKQMRLGRIVHALVLERDRFVFSKRYAVAPNWGKRSKADKAKWAQWAADNNGKEVIAQAEHDQAAAIAEAMMDEPKCHALLTDGEPEVSIVWDDPLTGIRCKARLDYLYPPLIGDVKTAADGADHAWAGSMADNHYAQQAAFYLDGGVAVGLEVKRFAFAVVESCPPYDAYVCVLDSTSLRAGRNQYQRGLHIYKNCLEKNRWPGRHEGTVIEVSLPEYALAEEGLSKGDKL